MIKKMPRFIDTTKLTFQRLWRHDENGTEVPVTGITAKDLFDLPPADVRPVVLCGDCRWFTDTGYPDPDPDMPELRIGHCLNLGREVQACWFCATGEQEEDADV